MKNRAHVFLLALLSALALSACGGGGGAPGTSTTPMTNMGQLRVGLTDAPACGFDAVNVTVAKVRVHQSANASDTDAGWTDITLNPARKINLLKLTNGALEDLGSTPLAVGHYSQLRLVVAANSSATPLANSVVPTGGSEVALDTPSAVQSGIKLIHEFDVAANSLVDLTLDFDACKSVLTRGNGNYQLKPTVSVIPTIVSGAITGYIDPQLAASHPVITAQINGAVVKATVPDASSGAFSLSPLVQSSAAGQYTVVVTADNSATAVITGVPVTAKQDTALSSSGAPIKLAASAMNSVAGTLLPIAAEGSVKANQTVAAGVTVAIKSVNADLATGAYALSLPIGAPSLAAYGSLPLAFTTQATAAGKYGIDASASGFATQQVQVDVSTAGATQNFVLK
ncbi:DUF4382 domain-containing protein [Massilia sp. TS11]|uniref:DUF4382 domain-containing protein n=1 Tax=Massilia sp. TS11 TaxID=2908003 RepID=UPI001ED9D430|nr:DUF4382 domain-containing protein [Massilia sp. TS11]MCG2585623.1 DUF4382 domain-containing protein [Massilia sp. TS11]